MDLRGSNETPWLGKNWVIQAKITAPKPPTGIRTACCEVDILGYKNRVVSDFTKRADVLELEHIRKIFELDCIGSVGIRAGGEIRKAVFPFDPKEFRKLLPFYERIQ
jgi:hypothetical protein